MIATCCRLLPAGYMLLLLLLLIRPFTAVDIQRRQVSVLFRYVSVVRADEAARRPDDDPVRNTCRRHASPKTLSAALRFAPRQPGPTFLTTTVINTRKVAQKKAVCLFTLTLLDQHVFGDEYLTARLKLSTSPDLCTHTTQSLF